MSTPRERTPVQRFDYNLIGQLDQNRMASSLGLRITKDRCELKVLIKSLEKTWEEAFPQGIDLVSHHTKLSGFVTDSQLATILDDPGRVDIFGSLADRTHPNANMHRRWALAATYMLIQTTQQSVKGALDTITLSEPKTHAHSIRVPTRLQQFPPTQSAARRNSGWRTAIRRPGASVRPSHRRRIQSKIFLPNLPLPSGSRRKTDFSFDQGPRSSAS